ncbi:MAG TPA: MerR family transcriptional regulator, partial [Salinimicrobium sp.]|nr:MerR family transcriptional regulator [Salinimicrobium sp.]
TIRMWEQRYNALRPIRSQGNTRYYDDSQLRRLLNIVSLLESNFKISQLGPMKDEELFSLSKKLQENTSAAPEEYFISQLISAGMEYDEPAFDKLFSHCLLRYGLKITYTKVLYPLLLRLGLLWSTNVLPPANEHFISNILRQKLFTSIDSLPACNQSEPGWLLFLPENEFHEIGLLFANYLLRSSGKKTIYLGSNVPLSSVLNAVSDSKFENLLFFLTHHDNPENVQDYLDKLKKEARGKNIYLAANKNLLNEIKTGKNILKLPDIEALENQL